MKIALIGYGKMGKAIERIAIGRGHEIVLRISSNNSHEFTPAHLSAADIAIEFTGPESALNCVLQCITAGVGVVSGSTGWNETLSVAAAAAVAQNVAFLHASNFSIGVNIFFEVNKQLAAMMNHHAEYDVSVAEVHHIHKKDAPGGTAITIANQILQHIDRKTSWQLDAQSTDNAVLPIYAERVGEVPGTHKVSYRSAIDTIDIIHTAHSREGFAMGAVLAAEYAMGKSGILSMRDVLGLS